MANCKGVRDQDGDSCFENGRVRLTVVWMNCAERESETKKGEWYPAYSDVSRHTAHGEELGKVAVLYVKKIGWGTLMRTADSSNFASDVVPAAVPVEQRCTNG